MCDVQAHSSAQDISEEHQALLYECAQQLEELFLVTVVGEVCPSLCTITDIHHTLNTRDLLVQQREKCAHQWAAGCRALRRRGSTHNICY